jgi:hypothetical protein
MEWFRRFGDIPSLDYNGSPTPDRTKLAGHDAVPEVVTFEIDGKNRQSLSWRQAHGSGSASPAQLHGGGETKDAPTAKVLLNLMEALELPGVPSDYHFLIQGCAEGLWTRRREEPEVYEIVEKLFSLDIRLIEARPNCVMIEYSEESTFFRVIAFQRLIDLYEREGFLREALDVALRANNFKQGEGYVERLRERIAAVEAEDAILAGQ